MILTMFRWCAVLAGVASLALPTAAIGACAAQDPASYDGRVPLVLLARALDGALSPSGVLFAPARFSVVAYEKGGGGAERLVDTGVRRAGAGYSDVEGGIPARPGELWRLYGSERDGVVETGGCSGSHRVDGAPVAPSLRVNGHALTPQPGTLAGDTTPVRAPRVRTRPAQVTVRSSVGLASVRLVRGGHIVAVGTHDVGRTTWTLRAPRGASRLVVDTGDRAYAGAFSRLAHR
jgi:hypothetical protein